MKFKKIFIKFIIFFIISSFTFLSVFWLLKDDKIVQKNVEIKIDINNIINICKTQEDDDLLITF